MADGVAATRVPTTAGTEYNLLRLNARMTALHVFLSDLCRTHQLGGRVRLVGETRAVVSDIVRWTDEMTAALLAQYPNGRITVESRISSLGGFVVQVDIEECVHMQRELVPTMVVAAALMAITYQILSTQHHLEGGTAEDLFHPYRHMTPGWASTAASWFHAQLVGWLW